jgi:GAF domain-containing protein
MPEDRGATNEPEMDGAGLALLRSVALRAEVAQRLESELQTALLRSIVGATVAIFEAEAASISLYRPASDTLEFVVACGNQGQGVVGLSIPASEGIAGYAYSGGEPIAIADPEQDPRFGKGFSAETGYVPRSILALPMRSGQRVLGVLEILDKRSGPFTMRDIALGTTFADQAAIAIQLGARALEARDVLHMILSGDLHEGPDADPDSLDELVSAATRQQSGDDEFWSFVDAVAGLRRLRPEDRRLAIDILDAVARHDVAMNQRHSFTRRLRR